MECCSSTRSRATIRIISAFRISPPAKKADKKAVSVFVHQFYVVTIHLLDSTGCCISPTITICRLTTYQLHFGSNSKFNMLVSCQEGWHRPALSLFTKVFDVFSCTLPKVAYFQKFAFAKRSRAMKAPVGLLSDRTVLRSKMEGPRPDKFTLTRHEFCGNLSQQFNIYIKGGAGAKDHGRERTAVQHLHPRSPRPAENSLFLCGGMGLDPQDSPAP